MTRFPDETPEVEQAEPEPHGAAARRTTLLTTGLTGTAGTLLGLATHGPAGLFFGAVGTAALLALEYHGTPEEYAVLTRALGPVLRRATHGREHRTPTLNTGNPWTDAPARPEAEEEMEPLQPRPAWQRREAEEMEPLQPRPAWFAGPAPHNDLPGGERPGTAAVPTLGGFTATRFTFSQVLASTSPARDQVLLGVLADGSPICCAARDLCHVALAGTTGGGKSSILRLLLAQLCASGASVLLLNPHYTHFDREADPPEDWTPFEPYLLHDPMACRRYEVIEFYLKQVATELLPRRLEKYAHSQPLGKPYFLAIEELPAIVAQIKEAPDYLARILREGRKVGVYLITVAQDFLVSTIAPGGGGAVRDCYRTAYYVGGDSTTGKILLDLPVRELAQVESALGQGTVLLRSSRVPLVKQAQRVRVPYVDNQALYQVLGPSTYVSTIHPGWDRADDALLDQGRPVQAPRLPPQDRRAPWPTTEPSPIPPARGTAGPRPVPGRLQQIAQVYEPGMSLTWLAGHLGISEEKAYTLLREAKARGLLKGRAKRPEQEMIRPVHQHTEQPAPSPEESLSEDERKVLEAYRNGAKTGMAIKSVTGVPGTRVNECLHKLGPVLGLIDWRPRQK